MAPGYEEERECNNFLRGKLRLDVKVHLVAVIPRVAVVSGTVCRYVFGIYPPCELRLKDDASGVP